MKAGDKVSIVVNGSRTDGAFVRYISRKNRCQIAIKKSGWHRDHWVTVSLKKVTLT